jgi:hypothetical protein
MGWNSLDDLVLEVTSNAKHWRTDWNKITGASAYIAGRWYDFSTLNGHPVANAFTGSALAFQDTNGASAFGMYNGGDQSPDTKHVLNAMAVTGIATGVPSVLMLVDMQGYWPGISMNSNSLQSLTGTPTLRYAGGGGLRLFMVTTVAAGATGFNLSYSYTDQDGNTGNVNPVTVAMTASGATSIVGHLGHSGTAANNYGPFLPLAAGDHGVQNVASVQFSAASGAGTAALVLARPLITLPLVTLGVATERDLLNQIPSLPQVKDDACLTWLLFTGAATAANTNFVGAVEFGWG